jgi:hypothetical protein
MLRELVRSDAWRSLGINARRFIDFLWLQHMAKGGQQNGKLKAPYRQLRDFGIDARYVAGDIREAKSWVSWIASEAECGLRQCTH